MKEIIYNLFLAFIGLFVIYIIFYSYLGLNKEQEGFEVDDENNPTPYDPKDAVDPANPDPESPPKPAAGDPVTSDALSVDPLPKGAAPLPAATASEGYSNDESDDESDDESEPTTMLGKISNFLFGGFEGFRLSHHQINRSVGRRPSPGRRPRYRGYHRRRDRHRRHRRRRRHNARRHYHHWHHRHYLPWRRNYHNKLRHWHRRRRNYVRAWWRNYRRQRWLAWRRRRAQAAARRRKITQPYINKWNEARRHTVAIRNNMNEANKTITDTNERNRLGRDASRTYRLKHRQWGRNHPWHHWRNQSWTNSVLHHSGRRRPRYGRFYKWDGNSGNYKKAIGLIRHRVEDKKRRDAEARKTNLRKAHWTRLTKKGHDKIGRFNKSRKGHMPGAFYSNLIGTYGLQKNIKDWKPEQIQSAHKVIDDKYDTIMAKRLAEMRRRQQFAINAMNAAREAQAAAQAASAGLAKADAAAQAEAAKAAAKAAAENANAISNMTRSIEEGKNYSWKYINNLKRNKQRVEGHNETVLRAANRNNNTMDDLLKLQAGRVAKVESVPMNDIKKISLLARRNYDASVTQKLNNA